MKRLTLPLAFSAAMFCGYALAATMSNNDVIKLIDAGMPEEVILKSINTSDTKFDTSPDALIKLKSKGATPAVLSAMMAPKGKELKVSSASAAPAGASAGKASSGGLNPEEVMLIINGRETPMQYIIAGNRTGMRALGFGGMASYAVLSGEKAQRRLDSSSVLEFLVSVPKNAQAGNYATLATLANRNNGTREVLVGGGYMSISSGIPKDRVVKASFEPLPDQRRAKEGFILYKFKPEAALNSGEYVLVLNTSEARVSGFFTGLAASYYDFGVD